jgi:TusA-related sulfurtransferase
MNFRKSLIFRHGCCNVDWRISIIIKNFQPDKKMTLTSKLNLVGIAWPVCLLKFKSAVDGLCACEVLEVSTQDPDVVVNITMIIDRSEDTLINQQKEGDVYRLSIQKH